MGLRAAHEAETVGQHLDRAGPHDLLAVFGHRLQDREHQVLLAQSGCALNTLFLGHGDEFGWRFPLEIVKMHVSIHETGRSPRSEEHTSELQSLMRISYDVFCLKKKKKTATA